MGAGIGRRRGYGADDLRGLAHRLEDANQSRRLLALAAVLDGHTRAEAAKIGGMDRQTLRDWVHRFNGSGPEGLIDRKAPGQAPKLSRDQKARLAELVDQGPISSVHGVVRWRLKDLVGWVWEVFRVTLSEQSMSRILRQMGFRPMSVRPKACGQDDEALAAFKKASPSVWRRSARACLRARRSRSGSRTVKRMRFTASVRRTS